MNYKKLDEKDINYLGKIITDKERILLLDDIAEEYSHDELSGTKEYPEMVIKPLTTGEISRVLKYANENLIPVTPRGTGTGLVGSAVPIYKGIVLDLTLMDKILELDEDNLTLTVEPGAMLMDIASFVEEKGYFYAPDPGEKSATIGGNISTNAGGMRAVKYGVTRDYVRGIEVVLTNGEVLNLGGKIVKNSSGYDIKDIIVGSEGTLGIITKAILKLLPMPQKTISLLVPFPSLKQAIRVTPMIIKSQVVPTAIEFMEREVIRDAEVYLGSKFPENKAEAFLLLKFDANTNEEIDTYCRVVSKVCMNNGAYDVLLSDTQEREEAIWKARGAFLEAIKGSTTLMDEVDIVVPRSKINDMIEYANELIDEVGIRIKSFGHAGDGNLHTYILKDNLSEEEWKEKLALSMEKLYEKGYSLKGQVSGEHGIGYAKKMYFNKTTNKECVRLMKGIKNLFDPKNILNPGKIFD